VYGDHPRYETNYFAPFPGYYFTGDGCKRDADGYYWCAAAAAPAPAPAAVAAAAAADFLLTLYHEPLPAGPFRDHLHPLCDPHTLPPLASRITGRVDDVINVSGHRIGTAEVEGALDQHPKCVEAAVVGYEHPNKVGGPSSEVCDSVPNKGKGKLMDG